MSELLVYKASAGSGKTFTLAVEYIKLLILNPKAYHQILAVTFTNKATAEMKERILSQLYGIHHGDPDSEAYLNRLVDETGCPPDEIRTSAGIALNYMLHDYSRFRVETIDSFFQSVMRNLARELDLTPNLNIELDQNEVLNDAVDYMIEQLDAQSPVLVWLLDYIKEQIQSNKQWNISDEIKKFGNNIFNEAYIEKGESLRRSLEDPNTIPSYKKQLKEIENAIHEEMQQIYKRFEDILARNGLTAEQLKGGSRSVGNYFRKLENGELGTKTFNTTAQECLASPDAWASKTSSQKDIIITLARSELIPLLNNAEQLRRVNNQLLNSCNLSLKHLNKVQLLASIDATVRQINQENNRFLLSDTNALLHRLVKEGDSSFVFEKIGTNIRHVMIDEFQDTSRMQWGNFKLLLLEGLANGADSLIVGDVKQSIYRWRNGDWSILNGLKHHIGKFNIKVKTLDTNRRSEKVIIEFNNLFFPNAVEQLNKLYQQEVKQPCEDLLQAYSDVVQYSPHTNERGYVRAAFVTGENTAEYQQQTLIEMGKETMRLLENGVRLNDIAILVRKKKNIPIIADYFDQELGLKIVSDEAFRLQASLAVSILIDAIRYLCKPDNRIIQAQLTIAYQCHVLQQKADWNTYLLNPTDDFLPAEFIARKNELHFMPLYELLEELFIIFELQRINQQDAYLFAFFDEVSLYLQKQTSDLDSFIRYWDENLSNKTIPSGELEGIRIFSIHKSKGLEFHTVLVPFCDWKMENESNDEYVWCTPPEKPFNQLDILPIPYSSNMGESVYVNDYLHERLQLWVDNLNILYVAFTRASKNLFIWTRDNTSTSKTKKSQNESRITTLSDLLHATLPIVAQQSDHSWNPNIPFEWGTLCTSEPTSLKASSNKLLQRSSKLPIQMESIRPSITFRQSNRSAEFIQGIDEDYSSNSFIHRGRMLHTLFSAIKTEADVEPAIQQLLSEGIINLKEEKMVHEVIDKAFSLPQIRHWYSGEWELFNECSILYKENGTVCIRRPDRVMMKKDELVVVDFKFGKENKKYHHQVQAYMQLLQRMGYSNIKGYLWYVDDCKIVAVHPTQLKLCFKKN